MAGPCLALSVLKGGTGNAYCSRGTRPGIPTPGAAEQWKNPYLGIPIDGREYEPTSKVRGLGTVFCTMSTPGRCLL
eukprot:453416-Rhodomonas_salina.3